MRQVSTFLNLDLQWWRVHWLWRFAWHQKQSIARAELVGAIAAARWCLHFQTSICLWCDSANTVRRIHKLQTGLWMGPTMTTDDHDLWLEMAQLLEQLAEVLFEVRWIPSHLRDVPCQAGWEEWIATWNNLVDTAAVNANDKRGEWFDAHRSQLQHHHRSLLRQLRVLKSFYFKVADHKPEETDVVDLTMDDTRLLTPGEAELSLSDSLSVNWKLQLQDSAENFKFPVQFSFSLIEAVCRLEQSPEISMPVSYIELALWMLTDLDIQLPVWDPKTRCWVFKSYFGLLIRPTVAHVISQIRQALVQRLRCLGLSHFCQKAISRLEAGITMPVDGLVVHLSFETASRLGSLSKGFGGSHPLRKSADLAKPIWSSDIEPAAAALHALPCPAANVRARSSAAWAQRRPQHDPGWAPSGTKILSGKHFSYPKAPKQYTQQTKFENGSSQVQLRRCRFWSFNFLKLFPQTRPKHFRSQTSNLQTGNFPHKQHKSTTITTT